MFLLKPQRPLPAAAEAAAAAARSAGLGQDEPLTGADLAADEWTYVAEGGANVLFRHHPTPATSARVALAFRGKLLRVKKCDVAPATGSCSSSSSSSSSNSNSSSSSAAPASVSAPLDGRDPRDKPQKQPKKQRERKPYVPHYPHPRQVLEYATNAVMPFMAQQLGGRAVRDSTAPLRRPPAPATDTAGAAAAVGATRAHEHNVYEQVAELLEVERRFLVRLNARLLALETRPAHRRGSQIDVALQCVMVLPDVTLPPPDDDNQLLFEDVDAVEVEVAAGKDGQAAGRAIPEEEDAGDEDDNGSMTDQTDEDDTEVDTEVDTDASVHLDSSSDAEEPDEGGSAAAPDPSAAPSTLLAAAPLLKAGPSSLSSRHLLRRGISDSFRNGSIFDCCFRNVCVELKPKIGFLPRGPLVPPIKARVCRFCMHQHYKKAAGKVEEISEYCPLDLFSRDAPRIRRALRALQRTPQNNFKVFVRSNKDEVVNVITGMSADALPKGASQARYSFCRRKRMGLRHSCQSMGFEHDVGGREDGASAPRDGDCGVDGKHGDCSPDDDEHLLPDVVDLLTQVLLQLDILEDLKRLQMLDHISVDGVWHVQRLLQRVEAVAVASGEDRSVGELVDAERAQSVAGSVEDEEEEEGSLARSVAFLRTAIDEIPAAGPGVKGSSEWRSMSLGQLRAFYGCLEQRFQVATTLKDCSLLLCLRRSTDAEKKAGGAGSRATPAAFDHLVEYEHPVTFRHLVFNCVVAIVDLDVKSHKSVGDYFRLDDKIVKHYVRTVVGSSGGCTSQTGTRRDGECCCEV